MSVIEEKADVPMIVREMGKGKFVRVNDSFKANVGFDATELAEKPFLDWIDPRDCAIVQAALENDERSFFARHITRDGNTLQLRILLAEHDEGLFVLGRCAKLPTQLESDAARSVEATASGTLDAIARIIEVQNPGYKCSILLVADGRFVFGAGPSLPEDYNAAVNGYAVGPTVGSCGTAIFWNTPVIVEDIQADPLWSALAALAKKAGVAACWSHPFASSSGKVLGALALYSPEPRTPTAEQLSLLKAAARITGLAVERGRAEEELKRADEALRQKEQFMRNILDTVDEGFIVIDRDYRIITANKAYCSQVGRCSDNIIGKHCYEISHKTDRPYFEEGEDCAGRHAFETGTPHTTLHRHKDSNGNILYLEIKAFPIKDASGTFTSVIEIINNITEKYLLEEERAKTQKLESIGTLAGGIAHDFNNLLQGVFGYISMAKLTHDNKDKSFAMLDQAEEALHMSVNLTTQLLTFSKGGKPVKKLIKLKPTIENAVKFALSGSNTDHLMEIAPDLWSLEADAGQLAQVIQNIVLNANEAMAGKGTVHVSAKKMDIPPKTNPNLPEGGQFIRIDIQDTGIGISEQNMVKIFDPYFTTKQRGSGLGLATSYSIIKNHGGLIEVKSEPNKGTTFTICLPASMEAEAEIIKTTPTAPTTNKIKILLMDDEDVVRSVAKEMVAALGHDVECAEDGRRAIELFMKAREEGKSFDLVILDLTVKGGMGGEDAIARIREIDHNVKAVVSSGYADSPFLADYRAYGFSAVLNKPYKLDSLKDCLDLFVL